MSSSQIPLGLIELPDLVSPLAAAGFRTVSGPDLPSSARLVSGAVRAADPAVAIVRQTESTSLPPYLTRLAAHRALKDHPIVLLVAPGVAAHQIPDVAVVQLPARLSEILDVAGIPSESLGNVLVAADGSVSIAETALHSQSPAADFDDEDWFTVEVDDPDPVQAPGTQQVAPPAAGPAPTPNPTPAVQLDPWGDPVEAPAPQQVAPHQAQYVTPHPVQPQQPQVRPAPTAAPQPVQAQPAQPQPVPVAPTLPQPDPWTMPQSGPAGGPRSQGAWSEATDPEPARVREALRGPESFQEPIRALREPAAPVEARWPDQTPQTQSWTESQASAASADIFAVPTTQDRGDSYAVTSGRADLCPVIVVFAAKGGVGKSTMSLNIAQRAAEMSPGLRVVLVDGNRAQGDARTFLRVGESLPSIYDASMSGNPTAAVASPDLLNTNRPKVLTPIRFGTVLAPVKGQVDLKTITPAVYASVIDFVRRHSDLVVIDSQYIGADDAETMTQQIIVPLLRNAGWGLAITETSNTSVDNIRSALMAFQNSGIARDRLHLMVNRAQTGYNQQALEQAFRPLVSTFHHRDEDPDLQERGNVGGFIHADPGMSEIIDGLLFQILGLSEFNHALRATTNQGKRGGFRMFGRRR